MKLFFYIVTALQIVELIYSYRRTKKIISIPNIFLVGVSVNFWLYLCNWSSLFVVGCYPVTYLVMGGCTLVVIIMDLVYLPSIMRFSRKEEAISLDLTILRLKFGRCRICFSTIVFLMCLCCAAIENITAYHSLFPFLNNIDSHKNSVAIWGTIWKAAYPIGLFSFYFENRQITKKKIMSYVVMVVTIVYLLIGGGSRFWSFLSIFSFAVFYFLNINKKIKLRTVILILVAVSALFRVFLLMGMTRLQASYSYMELIGYNGPFKNTAFSNIMSWFYGYFPYSFYNLNLTLRNIQINKICTYGQFFILPVLYLTKLYKFTNLDYTELALSVRVITNSSATVATAFFEFYSDFGYLFFLPMLFYCLVMNKFQLQNTLFGQGAYAYCLVCFFLFSFYNVFSPGIPITFIFLWWLFNKLVVKNSRRTASYT